MATEVSKRLQTAERLTTGQVRLTFFGINENQPLDIDGNVFSDEDIKLLEWMIHSNVTLRFDEDQLFEIESWNVLDLDTMSL